MKLFWDVMVPQMVPRSWWGPSGMNGILAPIPCFKATPGWDPFLVTLLGFGDLAGWDIENTGMEVDGVRVGHCGFSARQVKRPVVGGCYW